MTILTQPLRDDHQHLLPHILNILEVADMIGYAPDDEVCRRIDEVYEFLAYNLVPHGEAEDQGLYAAVGKILGSPESVATMRRDHVEVGRVMGDLITMRNTLSCHHGMTEPQKKELRRMLYGLYAIVMVHLAKEEEIYYPLLDAHLGPNDARLIHDQMERTVSLMQPSHQG